MIYFITFLLAYCSIIYELSLAQALSAFLGDMVLRYSITIGLYLASLGIGAFLCRGRVIKESVFFLLRIEILLSLIGGFSLVYLYLLDIFIPSSKIFFIFSHSLIIAIGIFSGFEIPLLIEIRRLEKEKTFNSVLGVNYIGALSGTVLFPILLLPKAGLLMIAFMTGLLNVLGGLSLLIREDLKTRKQYRMLFIFYLIFIVIFLVALIFSGPLENFLIEKYLSP